LLTPFFEKKPEKLWTWCSPDKCTKNQIDYILIKRRFRNAILDVETDPNADCDTDHNPLICKLRLRLQHKAEKSVTKSYIDWNASDEETLEKYQKLFWEVTVNRATMLTLKNLMHLLHWQKNAYQKRESTSTNRG